MHNLNVATIKELKDALARKRDERDDLKCEWQKIAMRNGGLRGSADFKKLYRTAKRTDPASVKEETDAKAAFMRASKAVKAAERTVDDAILEAAERRVTARPNGTTGAEAVYTPDGEHRFLRDLQVAWSDTPARERLELHRALTESRDSGTVQTEGFRAPSFWSEAWADQPRPAAVVRSAMPVYPMPDRGGLGYLPAFTQGAETAILTYTSGVNDAAQVADSTPVTSDYVTAELVTVTAVWDIDRAVFERARPAGELSFGVDILNAYEAALNSNLVNGDGSTGNHIGLLNVPGSGSFDGSGASTAQAQLLALAKAAASMFDDRKALPTTLVVNPKRFLYLTSGLTSAGAPLLSQGGVPANGIGPDPTWSSGVIGGMRCLVTDDVDEQYAVLWRPSDSVFGGAEALFQFPQIASSALAVRLQCYALSQSFIHRIPSSVTVVSGLPATGF